MLPSLHDDFVVSYEVNCESRQIKLHTRRDPRDAAKRERRPRTIVLNGVEGYQFEGDAFGNIISSLAAVSIEQVFADHGSRIAESYRMAGAPGPWAADLAAAAQVLAARGIKGFVLSSSYGLSGWVLAKEALVEPT
ncbi:hypothetical protein AAE026_18250 [Bradyrhizobium sp. DN5]|uniref:hypothetical protein n=1 Tax=Bradyrhizobium sp. DN5 TaxID=3056950 RepID=UPI003525D745